MQYRCNLDAIQVQSRCNLDATQMKSRFNLRYSKLNFDMSLAQLQPQLVGLFSPLEFGFYGKDRLPLIASVFKFEPSNSHFLNSPPLLNWVPIVCSMGKIFYYQKVVVKPYYQLKSQDEEQILFCSCRNKNKNKRNNKIPTKIYFKAAYLTQKINIKIKWS